MNTFLLLSNNMEHRFQMQEICNELDFDIMIISNVMDFILEVEKKDGNPDEEYLKLIQLIKKIRPRIPIICIADNDHKEYLQKIYNEGVFYLYTAPLNKDILNEVIKSSIVFKIKEDNLINKFTV